MDYTLCIVQIISKMAGAAGIEPAITVLETVAIPFNYAPITRPFTKNEQSY